MFYIIIMYNNYIYWEIKLSISRCTFPLLLLYPRLLHLLSQFTHLLGDIYISYCIYPLPYINLYLPITIL